MKTLDITKQDLEAYGTASLEGAIITKFGEIPQDLELRFEQTSDEWKRVNGGPYLSVIPEHVSYELVRSILFLVGTGHNIKVSTKIADPEPTRSMGEYREALEKLVAAVNGYDGGNITLARIWQARNEAEVLLGRKRGT